jgi:RimJ/RimL family protein N-acetyltransferase
MFTRFEIPTLASDRLTLRAFRADDIDAWAAMEADPDVRRYRGNDPRTRDEAWMAMQSILGQWAMRGYGVFVLELRNTTFAGFAGILHPSDWPEPELAYSLPRAVWGQGLAVEASAIARDWAFATHHFPRLASFIIPENTRSIRVAQKLGAVREGNAKLRSFEVEWWVHHNAQTA